MRLPSLKRCIADSALVGILLRECHLGVAGPARGRAAVETPVGFPKITSNATCAEWTAWMPPRSDPAVVMQVASKDYIKLQRNFIRLMEKNSDFTRENLYLMCLDDESYRAFHGGMGIRCLPLTSLLRNNNRKQIFTLRVQVVSCLVKAGHDVILSDADALWLADPMKDFSLPIIRESSIVASRGGFPHDLAHQWGSTMCMGFIFFRAEGKRIGEYVAVMNELVLKNANDQVSVNKAAKNLGIVWDREGSDMRYEKSVAFGGGTIDSLMDDESRPFRVTLLPHSTYPRICEATPISENTRVAHCLWVGKGEIMSTWMKRANLWSNNA